MHLNQFIILVAFNFPSVLLSTGSDAENLCPKNSFLQLKVMTFNTWIFGAHSYKGLHKIAGHILSINPDIVALQEIGWNGLEQFMKLLGPEWSIVHRTISNKSEEVPDTALITRHQFINESYRSFDAGVGSDIRINVNQTGPNCTGIVHVWSMHLDYQNYGPYSLCEGTRLPGEEENFQYNMTRLYETLEIVSRGVNARNRYDSKRDVPVILMGDFNEPSHLDWTEGARRRHCGKTYRWPVSKYLEDQAYVDTFRALFPDPNKQPGLTWSTVTKYFYGWRGDYSVEEPQDRIDFIYTKGSELVALNSTIYQGSGLLNTEPQPEAVVQYNDWPSDHFGVISDLRLALY